MKIKEIASLLNGETFCGGDENADITKVYAGDFLSRVMGKAPAGCVWLTVMANVNVAGVASLADIKAVVLCENVEPDKLLKDKCGAEKIALIKTPLSVYDCCKLL